MNTEKLTTKNGSKVEIFGQHGGKSIVNFNWFEEPNACFDCEVELYPKDGYLLWNCDVCGGGSAKLMKIK